MSTRVSENTTHDLTEVLAKLRSALAILDRLQAPECIGARLDHVIGEVSELCREVESKPAMQQSLASG